MTTRIILGKVYHEVPSYRCRSLIGNLGCSLSYDSMYDVCLASNCATGEYKLKNICFLSAEQYAEYALHRLSA